jgi:hypothetical protein
VGGNDDCCLVVAILRFFYSFDFWWDVADIQSFLSGHCLVESVECGCRTHLRRYSREMVYANPSLWAELEVQSDVGGEGGIFKFFVSFWSYVRTRLYLRVVQTSVQLSSSCFFNKVF